MLRFRVVGLLSGVVLSGLLSSCSFSPDYAAARESDAVIPDDGVVIPDDQVSATDGGCSPASWWRSAYVYRRRLAVAAAPFEYSVRLLLDASTTPPAQEITDRSLPSGNDVRIVWLDGSIWRELDRHLVTFDPTRIEIFFRIQEPGGYMGGTDQYFLYHGSSAALGPPSDPSNVYLRWNDFESYAPGSDAAADFDPLPAGDWSVMDDGGNLVYRATGSVRHSARLEGTSLQDAVFEARMKIVSPDVVSPNDNHNGLAVRSLSLEPATIDTYVAELRGSDQVSSVVTYDSGAFLAQNTVSSMFIETDRWYSLRVVFLGSTIDFFVDGALRESFGAAEVIVGEVGLFGWSCDVVFDDVKLRLLTSPEPTVTAGVEEDVCR